MLAAAIIPELYVADFNLSLAFYSVLGFNVLYARVEEKFAMLEREGAQIMIEQPIGRTFLASPLSPIHGSGINLQIVVTDAERLWNTLSGDTQIILPIEEHRYKRDDGVVRVRQFVIADPDGYVLRFSETIA